MEHTFIDKFSHPGTQFAKCKSGGLIHRLDPRVKIIYTLIYAICVVLTPPPAIPQFALFLVIVLLILLLSGVPPGYVMKSSLTIFPFVLLVVAFIPFLKKGEVAGSLNLGMLHLAVSYEGLWILWNVLAKSFLSIIAMILLASTTEFQFLLKGLEKLHLPKIFIMTLAFMYRYIFIIVDEAMRMERAHRARYFGGHLLRQISITGNIMGLLFIRSYERGERVYQSMRARGFDGEIRTLSQLRFTVHDAIYLCSFAGAMILVKILGVIL